MGPSIDFNTRSAGPMASMDLSVFWPKKNIRQNLSLKVYIVAAVTAVIVISLQDYFNHTFDFLRAKYETCDYILSGAIQRLQQYAMQRILVFVKTTPVSDGNLEEQLDIANSIANNYCNSVSHLLPLACRLSMSDVVYFS